MLATIANLLHDFFATILPHFLTTISRSFDSPADLFGHFAQFLLILSMLMRNITYLRGVSIASGVANVVYQNFFDYNPIIAFWEVIFILVNIGQLALIWWENRERHLTPEEQQFRSTFNPPLQPASFAALLNCGFWHEAPAGAALTVQGQPVSALLYVSQGAVRIESGDRVVATCSTGDFLGEMTWQTGKPATGTAVADGPVHYLRFERENLEKAMKARPELRFALQTSFNRNLIEKLVRTNQTTPARA